MESWFFHSRDADETLECAAALGRSIGAKGLAIALIGPLGAGKTVFVKGLASGLGVDPRVVSSPTFVIAQQYAVADGPEALHHVDLYRLESSLELEAIGFFDMLRPGQVAAVEWADRFPEVLGREYLSIEFEGPSPEEEDAARADSPWRGRRARVRAHGANAERVLADWVEHVEGRPASVGGQVVSSPQMRALMILILALAAFVAGRVEADFAPPLCEDVFELEADSLGSLRVGCGSPPVGVENGLRGIARWLDDGAVDLNRASAALLQRLPGVGPVRAAAIVEARSEAPFATVRELERVRGIGPRTRSGLEEWVFVAGAAPPPGRDDS
jgi:tRNA threonylcarbamoyladenosine biosynthesis protein TsaE